MEILDLKSTIIEIRISLNGFHSKFEMEKESVNLKQVNEIIQCEDQREREKKRLKKHDQGPKYPWSKTKHSDISNWNPSEEKREKRGQKNI